MHTIGRVSRRRRLGDAGGGLRVHGPTGVGTASSDGDDRGETGCSIGRGRHANPGHGVAVRRPSRSRAGLGGSAIHRRPGRDDHTSRDSCRRDVQPHALLHRQGAGARDHVRGFEVVRERSERGPQDRQRQGERGDRADDARSAAIRPLRRQGRHGRGPGDRQARAGEARRLLGADAHQREPGGRHRAGRAADRHGGRSGRPGSVRPKNERL